MSHYEADAYATWVGKRPPTEAEWEHAAPLEEVATTSATGAYTPQPRRHRDLAPRCRRGTERAAAAALRRLLEWI